MPLQPVAPTESALANQIANRVITEVQQAAQRIAALRATGVPAQAAVAAQTLPDGRVIPARPAVAGVSAAAINTALGTANCALLDEIKDLLEV